LLIAWVSIGKVNNPSPLAWLLVAMVSVWALRLSGYLTWRNWGQSEDRRYAKMRVYWGNWFPLISLFTVFLLQAALTWIIALPVQMGILVGGRIGAVSAVGLTVWAVGLFFEAVGDWQLARFKADPSNQGKVMDRGLWRYTRHPNYFGDFLVWWGLYITSTESGVFLATLVAPLLMSVLLMKVSGVTLLESSLKSRVGGYEEYARSTNAFFPWFPRR
jgi:steroid 5-alpha reductase family enzyme